MKAQKTQETEVLYKVLGPGGFSPIAGFEWNRPRGHPGKWMPPVRGRLVACKNGYHLCRKEDLVHWLWPHRTLFTAEYRGERVDSDQKIVVREARLLKRVTAWNVAIGLKWRDECNDYYYRMRSKSDAAILCHDRWCTKRLFEYLRGECQ